MRYRQLITQRSSAQIVGLFIVFPILAGLGILCHLVWLIAVDSGRFTTSDWFWQVGWYGLIGFGVLTALPAAGYQELMRRRNASVSPGEQTAKTIDEANATRK